MDAIKFKNCLKGSQYIDIIRVLARPYFWFESIQTDVRVFLRRHGLIKSEADEFIKNAKDSHKGERCFVVATGPSLTFEDLNLIKDEFSLSMNSCIKALDSTDWVPSIYGVQDEYIYNKFESDILGEAKGRLKGRILVADYIARLCPSAKIFPRYPHHFLNTKYDRKKIGEIKFSDDCSNIVYGNYSVIFGMLQIAVYMGFKEIYLLGCDCTYRGAKKNFVENGSAFDPNFDIAGQRLIYIHSKFKEFADSMGVRVYNCTRGGMLEEYPRKTLEEVLSHE